MLEECYGGVDQPPDRQGATCTLSLQDLLSDDDVTGLIMIGVMFAIIACLMYERYTTYKNLYRCSYLSQSFS